MLNKVWYEPTDLLSSTREVNAQMESTSWGPMILTEGPKRVTHQHLWNYRTGYTIKRESQNRCVVTPIYRTVFHGILKERMAQKSSWNTQYRITHQVCTSVAPSELCDIHSMRFLWRRSIAEHNAVVGIYFIFDRKVLTYYLFMYMLYQKVYHSDRWHVEFSMWYCH